MEQLLSKPFVNEVILKGQNLPFYFQNAQRDLEFKMDHVQVDLVFVVHLLTIFAEPLSTKTCLIYGIYFQSVSHGPKLDF